MNIAALKEAALASVGRAWDIGADADHARFIALANPSAILLLIERVERLEGVLPRAVEMLRIAAAIIREDAPHSQMFYDDANCDGGCVADDCESHAEVIAYLSNPTETVK
jgi:hypothetical protein